MITESMVKAGSEMASNLMNAQIEYTLGGAEGGCRKFDINNYPEKWHDIIMAYLTKDMQSVECIYRAMEMEKA